MTPDRPLLSVRAVATQLGVSVDTVRAWVRTGRLAALVIGDVIWVDPDDLDSFVADHKTSVTKKPKQVKIFSPPTAKSR